MKISVELEAVPPAYLVPLSSSVSTRIITGGVPANFLPLLGFFDSRVVRDDEDSCVVCCDALYILSNLAIRNATF